MFTLLRPNIAEVKVNTSGKIKLTFSIEAIVHNRKVNIFISFILVRHYYAMNNWSILEKMVFQILLFRSLYNSLYD